ncbi:hypothetical protein BSU01_12430 [Erwinia billingiae]|nr:hypothetical protein [Erwinia billingiae]
MFIARQFLKISKVSVFYSLRDERCVLLCLNRILLPNSIKARPVENIMQMSDILADEQDFFWHTYRYQ